MPAHAQAQSRACMRVPASQTHPLPGPDLAQAGRVEPALYARQRTPTHTHTLKERETTSMALVSLAVTHWSEGRHDHKHEWCPSHLVCLMTADRTGCFELPALLKTIMAPLVQDTSYRKYYGSFLHVHTHTHRC